MHGAVAGDVTCKTRGFEGFEWQGYVVYLLVCNIFGRLFWGEFLDGAIQEKAGGVLLVVCFEVEVSTDYEHEYKTIFCLSKNAVYLQERPE